MAKILGGGGSISPLTTKGDLYTYSTVNTRLPVGSDGAYLVADSTQTTGLKWSTAGTSQLQIPNGTGWVTYTPTFTSLGTVTNVSFWWRQVGDSIQITGKATTGTPTGSAIGITVPSGVLPDSAKTPTGFFKVGTAGTGTATTNNNANVAIVAWDSSNSRLTLTNVGDGTANNNLVGASANNLYGSGVPISIDAEFPVSGWTPSTTVNVIGTAAVAPTVQKFTSGSGTYTLPTSPRSPLYIRVRMVGGGGGGSGSGAGGSGNGGTGGNTTFGSSLLQANGGGGGGANVAEGGAGGSASLGSGPIGTALSGGGGCGASASSSGSTLGFAGGQGGSGAFGGGGRGGTPASGPGTAGAANTGAGGGGAAINGLASGNAGTGGGSGGFVDAIITSPSSTYSYSVGAGGTAGTAGTSGSAGGAGGSGYIEVTEYYQ